VFWPPQNVTFFHSKLLLDNMEQGATLPRNYYCSPDYAKRSFYRAAKAIFDKIGQIASEDVLLHLPKLKCITFRRDLQSLDFIVNNLYIYIYTTLFHQSGSNRQRIEKNLTK